MAFAQLLMRAFRDNAAFVKHDNAIRIAHRAQAMRDDEAGAAFHGGVERRQDLRLGLGVHGGGRIIENQDGGIKDQSTREGEALTLTAGQVATVLVQ